MILPDNGKVVVIDDRPDEVETLLSALSSQKVPHVYYKDEYGEDLPDEPLDNVRLIFLDLLLVSDEKSEPKKVISTIAGRLKKILSPDNGPFVLIYWSTMRNEYQESLEEEFKNGLSDYQPIFNFSLPKEEALKKEDLNYIKEELEKRFQEFRIFKAFLLWESLVNKSVGEYTNDFVSMFPIDDEWNENVKGVIYRLADTYSLQDLDYDQIQQIFKYAFLNLNKSFIDIVDNKVKNNFSIQVDDFQDYDCDPQTVSGINSRLHIYLDDSIEFFNTGNIYFVEAEKHDLEKIVKKNAEKNKTDILESDPKLIELDVTPSCDYAQNRHEYIRLLPGIIVDGEYRSSFKTHADYNYHLCPVFLYKDEAKYLLFDFRFLHSLPQSQMETEYNKPVMRLKNQLLTDIQSNLSSHINRPGVVSVF